MLLQSEAWNKLLRRARTRSVKLEALLRGCRPLVLDKQGVMLLCEHEFHRSELKNFSDDLAWVFGITPFIESQSEYLGFISEDPVMLEATQNLGAEVAT